MNNEIVENRWQYVREELDKFQKKYLSVNKDTQDKIQDLFDSLNITYQDLSKPISKKDKDRLKRKISKWKKEGIFRGYFKFHTEELMKGTITYRSLIEILLYGIEIEEQQELSDSINTLFISSSLSCYNQGRKDLKKKEKSILPQVLFTTFVMTAVNGIMWKDYIDAFYLTNMQEIQRRYLIALQQNKEPSVYDDTWQRIFEIQRNRLVDINKTEEETKYSGGLDKYLTTYGNMAYIEAGSDGNHKVMFISDKCDHVTAMCSYMDGMIFNTKDRNIFKRPMGKTAKDLVLQPLDIKGLVIGINQPPIEEHFHWCHSTLSYLIDKDVEELREEIFDKEPFIEEVYDESNDKVEYKYKTSNIISRVRDITSKTFQERTKGAKIVRIPKKYSYYNDIKKKVHLGINADEYQLIHELGHRLYFKLTKAEKKEYNSILREKFSPYTKDDFKKVKGSTGEYYVLKDSSEFINSYQTRVYKGFRNFKDNKPNIKYTAEYISVGVEYYYKNPRLLRQKDQRLYEFLDRMLKDE